jgi:pimeloyl-ACP methyl ester carboxylesterase
MIVLFYTPEVLKFAVFLTSFLIGFSVSQGAVTCRQVFKDLEITNLFVKVLDGKYEMGYDRSVPRNARNKVIYLGGNGLSFHHSRQLAYHMGALTKNFIRLDMLEVGTTLRRSIEKADGPYRMQDIPIEKQAQAVIEAIEALSSNKVIIVGLSYGGAVAAQVAKMRPDLVKRLMLVGPYVRDLKYTSPQFAEIPGWNIFASAQVWNPMYHLSRSQALESGFMKLIPGPMMIFRDYYLEGVNKLSDGVYRFDLTDVLKEVTVKTDILYGQKEDFIHPKFFHQSWEALPKPSRGNLVELQGGLHDLVTQAPKFVADWIFEGMAQ